MLPGQVGVSVVLRSSQSVRWTVPTQVGELEAGDVIRFTTGQGAFEYTRHRRTARGRPDPGRAASWRISPPPGHRRRPPVPSRWRRTRRRRSGGCRGRRPDRIMTLPPILSPAEQLMAGDSGTLWALVLWLQVLIALSLGAVWSWRRWGRAQTWVVFAPALDPRRARGLGRGRSSVAEPRMTTGNPPRGDMRGSMRRGRSRTTSRVPPRRIPSSEPRSCSCSMGRPQTPRRP